MRSNNLYQSQKAKGKSSKSAKGDPKGDADKTESQTETAAKCRECRNITDNRRKKNEIVTLG